MGPLQRWVLAHLTSPLYLDASKQRTKFTRRRGCSADVLRCLRRSSAPDQPISRPDSNHQLISIPTSQQTRQPDKQPIRRVAIHPSNQSPSSQIASSIQPQPVSVSTSASETRRLNSNQFEVCGDFHNFGVSNKSEVVDVWPCTCKTSWAHVAPLWVVVSVGGACWAGVPLPYTCSRAALLECSLVLKSDGS